MLSLALSWSGRALWVAPEMPISSQFFVVPGYEDYVNWLKLLHTIKLLSSFPPPPFFLNFSSPFNLWPKSKFPGAAAVLDTVAAIMLCSWTSQRLYLYVTVKKKREGHQTRHERYKDE